MTPAAEHPELEVCCPACGKPGLWLRAFFRKEHIVILECPFGCWKTFLVGIDPCVKTDEDLEP